MLRSLSIVRHHQLALAHSTSDGQPVDALLLLRLKLVPPCSLSVLPFVLATAPGYNQGTSGLDALWSGLPLISLPMLQWCSRMGAGLVRTIAMPEGEVHSLRAMASAPVSLSC